jgi:hypothetical protein
MNQGFEVLPLYQNSMNKIATETKHSFKRIESFPYPERQQ